MLIAAVCCWGEGEEKGCLLKAIYHTWRWFQPHFERILKTATVSISCDRLRTENFECCPMGYDWSITHMMANCIQGVLPIVAAGCRGNLPLTAGDKPGILCQTWMYFTPSWEYLVFFFVKLNQCQNNVHIHLTDPGPYESLGLRGESFLMCWDYLFQSIWQSKGEIDHREKNILLHLPRPHDEIVSSFFCWIHPSYQATGPPRFA